MPAVIRRLRHRLGGESGFTLVAVMGAMVVIALSTVAAFAAVDGDARESGKDIARKQALAAAEAGADWIIFGPVYDTPSKRGYGAPQGLEALERVAHAVSVPVIAIGGITPDRVAEALWAELHDKGVDVLGLILGKTDTPALRELEYTRGLLRSPDEAPPDAAAVSDVIAEAFENLGNGPTLMVGDTMRAAAQLLSSLNRNQAVELFAQAAAAAMGPDA